MAVPHWGGGDNAGVFHLLAGCAPPTDGPPAASAPSPSEESVSSLPPAAANSP
ncbi:hypothetical protein AYX15_07161 [Cryptococcus neoformans]|nr:hypothetical protein AYX15_07161 [Cryptococcus neoformans var. grubii]